MKDNGMTPPLVSFVVTFHDEPAQMLKECLDSILSLSLSAREREIIVVNDGGDADCLLEIPEVKDDIIYLRQPNRGLSEARNTGMRLCTGQYVQFVDADDYLLRVPYEHCLDLARYHSPDMVLFGSTSSTSDAGAKEVPFYLPSPVSGSEYMLQNNLRAAAWGYIFKRSAAASLTFRPGILHEDEEFTPQLMLRCERVFATKDKSYFYRQRPSSITHASDKGASARRLNDKESIIGRLYGMKDTLPPADQPPLQRRIDQMTLDYLYDAAMQTHSASELDKRIASLEQKGLFPPSDKRYTKKYATLRRLMMSKAGRRLLVTASLLTKR